MPTQADLIFAKIVVINNLMDEESIKGCLQQIEQLERMGQHKPLHAFLLENGYLRQDQINKIKAAQELHFKVKEDHQYGQICIQAGFLNANQVQECLGLQKQRQYKERLFQLLINKGYLSKTQHRQVLSHLAKVNPSSSLLAAPKQNEGSQSSKVLTLQDPFAQAVVQQNFATPQQVYECIEIQKQLREMGIQKDLSSVMVDKNYLSPNQVRRILAYIGSQAKGTATATADPSQKTPPPQKTFQQESKPAGNRSPIEGYEIECKLGQGAMGVIYKGRHLKLNRVVALKVLLPEFAQDKEFIQRFFREAKAAITLNHPNIIQGYHVGESNGFYYFAMEYVEGGTVKQMIREKGVLEEEEAIKIVIQICRALDHAQEHNIVHRDIKPDNIMVTKEGLAKLCDLGIAKEINQDGSLTQTGIALGTPYYISPEQAMGEKKIDIRSDIYSLGATFFHMVTGRVPYEGDTSAVIMTKHISEEPPNPRDINSSISVETSQVIMKMMAKERPYRYQNPLEVIQDLEAIQSKDLSKFGSGSSVFIQDGLKIPKESITRVSQIRKTRTSQIRKAPVKSTQHSNLRKGLPRPSLVSEAYKKPSNPIPFLMILAGVLLIILVIIIFLYLKG
ncbi:MAG: serine/threonine protein kinase [Planctomycetota bacterium]|nr:MAG: serine/threonine protein kinase [Planctomycetota bacterium]